VPLKEDKHIPQIAYFSSTLQRLGAWAAEA